MYIMKKVTLLFALLMFASAFVIAQPQLSWRFANYEVVNAGTQLQFDVEVKADVSGSFHRDLQIYFDYNTAGFGSDIVANGKISVSPLALMDVTKYTVVNLADNTSSKFAIITEAIYEGPTGGQPGSATYFKEITTSYQGLLRFSIDVASNVATAGIAFDNLLMNGGEYYQSTSNTDPLKYLDGVYDNNGLNTLLLSSVYGTVTYNNAGNTPLKLCTMTLTGGDTYGPTINDGKYYFTGMVDGAYEVAGTSTNTWNGSTTFDATLVLRYAGGVAGFDVLTNLQKRAADVNMTNTALGVTTFDATLILRRAGGVATPQWTAPDFVFDGPYPAVTPLSGYPVNVAGGLGNANFKALCSGDVNGNYTPPVE
jgi:hypothetical protein